MKPDRLFELLAMGGEPPKLTDRHGDAGLVSESLLDVEGAAVLGFGFGEVAVVAREGAEVVVGGRYGCLVSESLVDVEGAAVLGFGFGEVATVARKVPRSW